jgi:hypothetical protein
VAFTVKCLAPHHLTRQATKLINFLHLIYINNILTTINYILLLPETIREWLLSDSVKHVIIPALWTIDMNMLS